MCGCRRGEIFHREDLPRPGSPSLPFLLSCPVLTTESTRPGKTKPNNAHLKVARPFLVWQRHQVSRHPWVCLLSKFQVVMNSLWDKARGLCGVGCALEPLCWLESRRERQQEGAEELQAALFLSDKGKGERSRGLTLECPGPLGQDKDSADPPQTEPTRSLKARQML